MYHIVHIRNQKVYIYKANFDHKDVQNKSKVLVVLRYQFKCEHCDWNVVKLTSNWPECFFEWISFHKSHIGMTFLLYEFEGGYSSVISD